MGATRRVNELAPRINYLITELREKGVTIIHCPSDTEEFYKSEKCKAYSRANELAGIYWDQEPVWSYILANNLISPINNMADPKTVECDCGKKKCRKPQKPAWTRQNKAIVIDDEKDYICMDNNTIYSVLQNNKLEYVLMVGVHTNMCILNRKFGTNMRMSIIHKESLCNMLSDDEMELNAEIKKMIKYMNALPL